MNPPPNSRNANARKVLAIDDQPAVLDALGMLLEIHEIPFVATSDPQVAEEAVRSGEIGVVVQDMNFAPGATDGEEGIALFRRLKAIDPDLPILLITAWTSLETAVQLVKEGASDYLAKPWDDAKLIENVRRLLAMREAPSPEEAAMQDDAAARPSLVYRSRKMRDVVALAESVARSTVPILISGPNGCGKEGVADLIHAASPRRDAPLVKVNVGALPLELMEAELFGAEAGAFTGARKLRKGRFEAADGGTLFLDEINSLSLAGQVKLLRVLESSEFSRLGSSETRRADVRVLSATNTDLQREIAAGSFREDLYYRLNVVEVKLPPLADREDDVLLLADHFLKLHAEETGQESKRLDEGARSALLAYPWPGNVRELRNRIQRACLVNAGPTIAAGDLDLPATAEPPAKTTPAEAPPRMEPADESDSAERDEVERILAESGGIVSRAAKQLGVSRQALYRKMSRLGISIERRTRS